MPFFISPLFGSTYTKIFGRIQFCSVTAGQLGAGNRKVGPALDLTLAVCLGSSQVKIGT